MHKNYEITEIYVTILPEFSKPISRSISSQGFAGFVQFSDSHEENMNFDNFLGVLRASQKCRILPPLVNSDNNLTKGVARGGGKGGNPPPETEKIVVEKWCYFRELYF